MVRRMAFRHTHAAWSACALLLALAAGCRSDIPRRDHEERSLPLLEKARAASEAGELDKAVAEYRKALDLHPQAARGHLDFAILLHDVRKDYVDALYHYQAYLRLRPETEKTDMIRERMRLAKLALAAQVLPSDRDTQRLIQRLESENRVLQARVAELETLQAAVPEPGPAGAPPPASLPSADGNGRRYTVERGDTLSSIALRFYGDAGKWRILMTANRDSLGGTDRVRVGQVLRIPREGGGNNGN